MLAKVCLKRFRFVLYAALFFLITLHITDRTNSGLIATICIWFALPLAFIAFVWWIYACIRDIVRFFKSGAVPEDAPTWAERSVWWVQDELAEIASLDDRGKVRFFLFRVGGVALAALGLVLIVRDSIVLGTMLLIGGLALCVSASPQSVNRNSPDNPSATPLRMWIPRWASLTWGKSKPFPATRPSGGRTSAANISISMRAKTDAICISARTLFPNGSPPARPTAKRKTSRWTCLSCSPIYAIALKTI